MMHGTVCLLIQYTFIYMYLEFEEENHVLFFQLRKVRCMKPVAFCTSNTEPMG